MRRLLTENQLGLLINIFPTANHTRYQHSLGVYHAVCEYILALYNDSENPIFKIFYKKDSCEKTILAALLHDIGHSSFGHELEEVDKEVFSHRKIGKFIINNDSSKDTKGRLLSDIIRKSELDCWGLNVESFLQFLEGKSLIPIEVCLYQCIDGQLDSDKLDYLKRDSIECRVKYGNGIDYQKFLRSLSTFVIEKQEVRIELAIKKKGAASAEAFAFARYQLYQSLYWHHTIRSIKSMYLTSIISVIEGKLNKDKFNATLFSQESIMYYLYLRFIICLPENSLESMILLEKDKKLK